MDTSLLQKNIGVYARKVGRVAARPVVTLYLVLRDPKTPRRDKYLIYSALAYVLLPIDLISAKKIPILGWADEAGSIAVAFKKVVKNITPEIEQQTEAILDRWFTHYDNFETVE